MYLQDRDALSLKLEDTENWLYEDGEDQSKQVYIDKLAELKVFFALVIGFSSIHYFHCISLSDFYSTLAIETWPAHPGEVHRG